MRSLYSFLFRILGWKVEGHWPNNLEKYLLVVAPHTSNWDFLVGLGARAELNFDPKYAAKKELFSWPIGWLFKKLGGYPVERTVNNNFVQSVVDIFNKEEKFILTITPEGTRKKNNNWKTGFYFIAKQAKVPIVPVGFDFSSKRVVFHEPIMTNQPVEELVLYLKQWFSQFNGKNPQQGVSVD